MLVNEAKLVHDIRHSLGKQIIDVDVIANTMNDFDMENEEQITFKQVESVLEDLDIKMDKLVLERWMNASRTIGTYCSISRLVQILHKAVNPVYKLSRGKSIHMKKSDEMMLGVQKKSLLPPRPTSSLLHDPDIEWKTKLQLRFSEPVHRNIGLVSDEDTKKKNVEKLKHAMYQSYQQQEGQKIIK